MTFIVVLSWSEDLVSGDVGRRGALYTADVGLFLTG